MTQVALHYYRYISSSCTITKATGGTVTLSTGWYCLSGVINALRVGSVTCSWDSDTNATAFSPAISCDNLTIREMLGITTGSQSASSYKPLHTWVPANPEYMQDLAPMTVSGRKQYDSDFYVAQSGNTVALGSVTLHREIFTFSLINKNDVFTISGDSGLSAPYLDSVYAPDKGIVFELKMGDDVSNEAGYAVGSSWVHVAEPDIVMQMPPWDVYYTLKMECNRYDF